MIIDSKNIEFGYELISVLPYAYYLHKKGKLSGTISGNDTESLYFFSPDHKINTEQRDYHNIKDIKYPNAWIHKPYLELNQFAIPNYRKQFANKEYQFDKETIVICNRHNKEWSYKPINYFNLPTLEKLFKLLQNRYQVVYINIEGRKELYDNAPPETFGDFELLKKFPKVINFHDLSEGKSFNETQLKVFANCEKYITMNGGHAILAAYFGGENIVMSKYDRIYAKEIHPQINSFYTFYHEFSGQRVVSVHNEKDLIKRVKLQYVDNNPIVNILVRTSKRPEYFKECIKSIEAQTYKNINVFVSLDNEEDKYTIPYKVYSIKVVKKEISPVKKQNYGIPFPSNLYLNELKKHIQSGLIFYLDDDDQFSDEKAIEKVVSEYKKGNDLIFWRVKLGFRIIPKNGNFGNKPVAKDISGIGLAFDSKYNVVWEPYKLGDFRIATYLYETIKRISYIDEKLTKSQDKQIGYGLRFDKNNNDKTMKTIKIRFTKVKKGSKYKSGEIKELPLHVARQYVITRQAVFHEEKKKEDKPKQIQKQQAPKKKRITKKKYTTKEKKGTLKIQ